MWMSTVLPSAFSLRLELLHVGGRNAFILPAKDAEDGGIDLLQRGIVGGKMAVIDDRDLQLRDRR